MNRLRRSAARQRNDDEEPVVHLVRLGRCWVLREGKSPRCGFPKNVDTETDEEEDSTDESEYDTDSDEDEADKVHLGNSMHSAATTTTAEVDENSDQDEDGDSVYADATDEGFDEHLEKREGTVFRTMSRSRDDNEPATARYDSDLQSQKNDTAKTALLYATNGKQSNATAGHKMGTEECKEDDTQPMNKGEKGADKPNKTWQISIEQTKKTKETTSQETDTSTAPKHETDGKLGMAATRWNVESHKETKKDDTADGQEDDAQPWSKAKTKADKANKTGQQSTERTTLEVAISAAKVVQVYDENKNRGKGGAEARNDRNDERAQSSREAKTKTDLETRIKANLASQDKGTDKMACWSESLLHEYKELKNIVLETSGYCASPVDEKDPFVWQGTVHGPIGSPYEGGVFHVTVVLPPAYPQSPPKLFFKTPIYHANVETYQHGGRRVYMTLLEEENWKSPTAEAGTRNIEAVLKHLRSVLVMPETPACRAELGVQFIERPGDYKRIARLWTKKLVIETRQSQRRDSYRSK